MKFNVLLLLLFVSDGAILSMNPYDPAPCTVQTVHNNVNPFDLAENFTKKDAENSCNSAIDYVNTTLDNFKILIEKIHNQYPIHFNFNSLWYQSEDITRRKSVFFTTIDKIQIHLCTGGKYPSYKLLSTQYNAQLNEMALLKKELNIKNQKINELNDTFNSKKLKFDNLLSENTYKAFVMGCAAGILCAGVGYIGYKKLLE